MRYKILFKIRRFQIQTFSRLAFILKKPVGGANLPLPAQNRVNKTEFMVVTTKQNKPELNVSIGNNPIKQSHHIKYLGVLIDDNRNWKQQIKEQCSKVARGSWALNQLKHFVDEQTLRSVYHCLIYSHLQYCISSWETASKSTLAPLFILQKRSIRLLTGSGYREHTNPLFYRAKCLKLKGYLLSGNCKANVQNSQ